MSDTMAAPTVALGRIPARAPRTEAARFASVYERHHQALYRYCRSILRHDEDAQDALQSAMTRAFAALQTERRELELRPWLFRIAHNEAVTILRRRTATCALDEQLGDAAALEDRVFEREALRVLQADLAGLTERQRCALVLRELNGLAHEEIAAVLDTSPAAVKQAIFEARSALLRCREGRDTACGEIRRMLSDGDGRVLRGRRVRAHLQTCSGCRGFRDDLSRRPRELAALAPPLPAGAAAGILRWIGGGSAGGLGAGSAAGGGSAGALLVGTTAGGGGLAAKAAVAVVIAGGVVALQAGRPAPLLREAPGTHAARLSATGRSGAAPAPSHGHRALVRDSATTPSPGRRADEHGYGGDQVLGPSLNTVGTAGPVDGTLAGAVPGQADSGTTSAGHAHTQDPDSRPPEQARQGTTPPAEADRESPGTAPPAQAGTGVTPTGQARGTTPPGQARRESPGTSLPGQAGMGITPPGQARQQASGSLPPGQAGGQAGDIQPPGRAREGTTPPGQGRTQASDSVPPEPPGRGTNTPGQGRTPASDSGPTGQPRASAGTAPGQDGSAATSAPSSTASGLSAKPTGEAGA